MAAARSKATNATQRRGKRQAEATSNHWFVDADGNPMAQISVTASELIPTGQFANVVVGPVTVTKFVEDKNLSDQINDLAEMVEADCIAEQRVIVLASLQAEAEKNKS